MLPKRQNSPESAILLRSLGLVLPSGHAVEKHVHRWHQLIFATEGVMTVSTANGVWVAPPQKAVWIVAGFEHAIRMTGRVHMNTLYFPPDTIVELPCPCCVVSVTPLLRELIVSVVKQGMLWDNEPKEKRLAQVIVDQLNLRQEVPLQITYPQDSRAAYVAHNVQQNLDRTPPLSKLVLGSGASLRTIERLFVKETGLTFSRWVQRVKALYALERLASGDSVTQAGLAVGYRSTSAFIEMFKKLIGTTPGRRQTAVAKVPPDPSA